MKLNNIEYFIVVAECGSISLAAKKLYIAQPSLTKAIHAFEEELGTALFERTRSGMVLTETGKAILPEAKQIMQYYNGWKARAGGTEINNISICSHVSLAGFLFPDIILHFRKKYPNIDINYFTDAKPEKFLSDMLTSPFLVFSICDRRVYKTVSHIPGICGKVIINGRYGCLVNSESPLAERFSLSMDELRDYFLVLPNHILMSLQEPDPPQTAIMNFLPRLVNTISYKHIIEVDTVGNVIDSVRRHQDVYALSFSPAHNRYEGVKSGELRHVPLHEKGAEGVICLFYSAEAYGRFAVVRELVKSVQTDAQKFFTPIG